MSDNLIRLHFPHSDVIDHPEDVARMRRILNERGYDASPDSIQAAYRQYSDELWAAGWKDIDGASDYYIFADLYDRLVRMDEP